ncbi:CHAT domain-containing protein [Streptomyces virginiae]|uniref:CHAT domain-containing protein n=1 Tax=Streptomyces virginiae TaxID=1961 RepID=UPI00371CB176
MAHLACHGASHPTDTSQSLLLLHDWQQDPLTVAGTPVNLNYARLAHLPACSTALTRNQQLLDESIHLTAAFQLAGFPHVIGTLWEINDGYSADITDVFSTRLTDSEKDVETGRAVQALHDTIRSLRDQLPVVAGSRRAGTAAPSPVALSAVGRPGSCHTLPVTAPAGAARRARKSR